MVILGVSLMFNYVEMHSYCFLLYSISLCISYTNRSILNLLTLILVFQILQGDTKNTVRRKSIILLPVID